MANFSRSVLRMGLLQQCSRRSRNLFSSQNKEVYRRSLAYSSDTTGQQGGQGDGQTTINSVKPGSEKKASLVIFDKDGTLICCQSMWSPWARKIAAKLEDATQLTIKEKVFKTLGFCSSTDRVIPGLLAEATHSIVKEGLIELLAQEGVDQKRATVIVDSILNEESDENTEGIRTFTDLKTLFRILKNSGVKVAVCTSDSRKGTEATLQELGVEEFVDQLVCGDDPDSHPKPAPHNAYMICDQLGVDPADTAMVGDTKADVGMGKAAKLGWNIGVLSGVGQTKDLYPEANHIIESVKDLLPIILPKNEWRDCYAYSSSDRILMEPPRLEHNKGEVTTEGSVSDSSVALVIFDLHGTILCPNNKYSNWLEKVSKRLEQITGLNIKEMIYKKLGMCLDTQQLTEGLLEDHGISTEVKSALMQILIEKGLGYEESLIAINKIWDECHQELYEEPRSLHKDIKQFFKTLKKNNVKIAICTGDLRELALSDLKQLGVLKYVDMMVCGDDPQLQSKSSEQSTQMICDELSVESSKTILVSDSAKDFVTDDSMGIQNIGVLTGIGSADDLKRRADLVVPTINQVIDHIVKDRREQHKRKPSSMVDSVKPFIWPDSSSQPGMQTRHYGSYLGHSFGPRRQFYNHPSSLWNMQKRYLHISSNIPSYDYVIVGAGSAGCTLTNRISESPDNKVLVMEAGPKDTTWKIHMPAALMYNLCDDKYNWYYHTEPEQGMNNRVMYWPRGRVWGGSSSLNAMVYIRGNALDYNNWEDLGAEGWSYADCLPYFRKAQSHELGSDDYRGGDGPLHVSRGRTHNPLHRAFIDAAIQAGYPFTEDMNGYQQEGVGWMDMTIHKGRRWSASMAYLRPALKRLNVEVASQALATRIVFDKNKAVGIQYEQGGQLKEVRVDKEIILSGGAINSPQLLMLSGIGNADDLRKLDIPVVNNLPGVGENLQDHLEVYVQQECRQPITLYSAQWKYPHNMVKIGLEWFIKQTGDGATAHLESGGFIRSQPGVEFPNIQFHFLPSVVSDHGRKNGDRHAYQVHVGPLRPTSRGYLKIKSRNPQEHPKIVANYLTTEQDVQEMRDSVVLSREIFKQIAFDPFRGPELQPGANVNTDTQIDEFIRTNADSAYHPSCTCKMGSPYDPLAVVDPQTRVLGVENLRVVDASIMPSIVSGNLNGPTIMVAEKAADIILGQNPLPRSKASVYRPKSLDSQR